MSVYIAVDDSQGRDEVGQELWILRGDYHLRGSCYWYAPAAEIQSTLQGAVSVNFEIVFFIALSACGCKQCQKESNGISEYKIVR